MWLEDHFGNGSILQRNERVKLAASFWNNVGAGMVIGGMAAAFFLDKPQGTWTKIGIAIVGLVLGWLCYSIVDKPAHGFEPRWTVLLRRRPPIDVRKQLGRKAQADQRALARWRGPSPLFLCCHGSTCHSERSI